MGYLMSVRSSDIGVRLRLARERLGLSRRRVSTLAGLAPETVYSIENTNRVPGIDTAEKLASVLGVSPAWLAYGGEKVQRVHDFKPAPGFDGLARAASLDAILRGAGGHIDQSFLYLDPLGAQRYMEIAQSYRGLPLKEAAASILTLTKEPITLVALGAGHARHESALAEDLIRADLVDDDGCPSVELVLVDSSAPMLSTGFRHASAQLGPHDIPISTIEGDFTSLPTFSDGFTGRAPRRKLFTLLGYTLGNMENELSFLRQALMPAVKGDLLLLDFLVSDTNSTDPKKIIVKDPVQKILSAGATARTNKMLGFLAGPVTRHFGENVGVSLRAVSNAGAIPKSYAVEFWVTVDGDKHFMTASWRRYNPQALAQSFSRVGWKLVESWQFGPERPSLLALFQRVE